MNADEIGFDYSRSYFNGCSTFAGLTRHEPLVGPLTPQPHRSLADTVFTISTRASASPVVDEAGTSHPSREVPAAPLEVAA